MANVPTDERETVHSEPVTSVTIRDAILKLIPDDPNITRDIRIHDGIADIHIKWRSLRWSTCMAYQTMTPDQIADKVSDEFRLWLASCLKNMNGAPRHSRVLTEIAVWLRANPDRADWLTGEVKSNKTTMEAA